MAQLLSNECFFALKGSKLFIIISMKGVKNEACPINISAFKIFNFIVFKNHYFRHFFFKSCFIIFIDV